MLNEELHNIFDNINLSEEDKKRIVNNGILQKRVKNKVFIYSKQIVAVIVFGILCTASLTCYAAVSAYQAYMEQMDHEELQERYDNVQEGTKEADSYSRELLKTEKERMNQLRKLYEAGLQFPESSIYSFDGTKAKRPDDKNQISYDYVNRIIYLPEQELTDEELLQIIDMGEKANYSLNIINKELGVITYNSKITEEERLEEADKEMQKNMHDIPESDENRIKQSMEVVVEQLIGRKTDGMELTITFYGEYNPRYMIDISDEYERIIIFFTEDSTIEDWSIDNYIDMSSESAKPANEDEGKLYSEEEMQEEINKFSSYAITTLSDCFFIDSKVVRCQYGYSDNELSENKSIIIGLTSENGNRYGFFYNKQTGKLYRMETYEAGRYDDIDFFSGCKVSGEIEVQ